MRKKIIAGMFVLGMGISCLYANNNKVNMNDAKALYSCIIQKMTKKQKTYIKKYAFLIVAYPDNDINKFLNINKKEIKNISLKAGEAFVDLVADKCKKETENLFVNNSLPIAYMKYTKVLNGVTEYLFATPKDKDPEKMKEIKNWLEKGMVSNKTFQNLIHKIYEKKMKSKLKNK